MTGNIGRYELHEELGTGGFATVYRAHDPTLDRVIAVKVLHPHVASNPELRSRFVREGRALAKLHHPNLVQVFDAGEADGRAYLAMEYVPGHSLDALTAGRKMPLAELVPIIRQVAGALDAVHKAGLVHRDVKPANVRVTDSGRAVLLDLGIAHDSEATRATSLGLIIGTPGFLAPEQVDASAPVTPQTDVYQLGASVFAMLAAEPPFRGDTAQVLFAVVARPPLDLGELRPDLPATACSAVAQAMAKQPAARQTTASEFAAALVTGAGDTHAASEASTVYRSTGGVAAAAIPGLPAKGRGTRRSIALAAVVAGVVVAGALALWQARRASPFTAGTSATAQVAESAGQPSARRVRGSVLTIGGGRNLAELPFDGKAGERVSIGLNSLTRGSYVSVIGPNDEPLFKRQFFYPQDGFIDALSLPLDGKYTIVAEPENAAAPASTMGVERFQVPVATPSVIAKDGMPRTVTTTVPGQNLRMEFDGGAGDRVALRLRKVTVGSTITFLQPDGEPLAPSMFAYPGDSFQDTLTLPVAGRYAISIDPQQRDTGSLTLSLFAVPADVSATLAIGAPGQVVTVATPGQNARLAFRGKAGQSFSLRTTQASIGTNITIVKPDGEPLLNRSYLYPAEGFVEPFALRDDGTHQILLDPNGPDTGSMRMTLYAMPPDSPLRFTAGRPLHVKIGTPGQQARIRFHAPAGMQGTLRFSAMTIGIHVKVLADDGSEVQPPQYVYAPSGELTLNPIPAAGDYDLLLDANGAETGEMDILPRAEGFAPAAARAAASVATPPRPTAPLRRPVRRPRQAAGATTP